MKTNVNISLRTSCVPQHFKDNRKVITLNVDNFPADNPAYKKSDGFRCNDVSLLDRLSFDMSFDTDFAKIVAGRVKEIIKDKPSDLSEKDMLRTLRPSYVQTASEVKAWEETVYQYMTTTSDVTQEEVDKVVQENSDSVVENEETKSE